MGDAPERTPWYKRPFLPRWLPGWLLGSLICGVVSAVVFNLGLRDWSPLAIVMWFAFGFGFMLVILSLTYYKAKGTEAQTGLFPPLWVRQPVMMAIGVGIGASWVDYQRIAFIEGPCAVSLGILLMLAIGAASVAALRQTPGLASAWVATVSGLLVVAAGLVFAVVRIAQVYF